MENSKYNVDGYGEIEVDETTKEQLEKTRNDAADVSFDPYAASVRISILMEGDLLAQLKSEAKKRGLPYQTLTKDLLRKALWQEQLKFEPKKESFECIFEGFTPCLKIAK